jgi:thiol-disulfide isomerase/thioredoxin
MWKNLLIVLATGLAACNAGDPKELLMISGSFTGQAPDTVWLMIERGEQLVEADTSLLVNGRFQISYKMEEEEMVYLKSSGAEDLFRVFTGNGSIEVQLEPSNPSQVRVKGSALHDLYTQAMDSIARYDREIEQVVALYRSDSILRQQYGIDELVDEVYYRQLDYIRQFIKMHSASPVSAYLANRFLMFDADYEEVRELAESFTAKIPGSRYTEMLNDRASLLSASAAGQPAPDISLPDALGDIRSIQELRGKYVLVDFWASWCGPCRRANPELVKLYNETSRERFEIFGVSLDKDKDAWMNAIESDSLDWLHVSDLAGWESVVSETYGINSIPHAVLIDPAGLVRAHDLPLDSIRKIVQ